MCRYRLPGQYTGVKPNAVVFGTGMEMMPILMGAGGDQRHHYFVNEGHYSHFYFLPNDHKGEFVLQLLCQPEKKAMLDSLLMQTLIEPRLYWYAEHDAWDGDMPVLLGYTCDMPKIKRYAAALKIHEFRGWLYCFVFQKEALQQICGPSVEIRCIGPCED